MKTCSTCGNSFSDDLSFCLQDGTVLKSRVTSDLTGEATEILRVDTADNSDLSSEPTVVDRPAIPAAPVAQKMFQMSALEPSSRMGCVLSIGQVAAALVVVVGLGVAGLVFLNSNNADVAMLENRNAGLTNSTAPMMNSVANSTGGSTGNVPTTPRRPTPRTISAGDVTVKAIELPKPAYPSAARQSGVQGSVNVQVLVGENGRVVSARAMNGHPLLKTAAEEAARTARFDPMVVDGAAVKFTGVITYNFVL